MKLTSIDDHFDPESKKTRNAKETRRWLKRQKNRTERRQSKSDMRLDVLSDP